ncbi:MAG: hypothetical protein HY547_00445 [Elusimicrobia bacterium]|nr:hypothetical protein [Elusimicrobiota bacterium]
MAGNTNTVNGVFDFGAKDARISTLAFANTARFFSNADGLDQLHVVCHADYYPTAIKNTIEALFGEFDGSRKRTAQPLCGEFEQDEPGTSQGIWFATGTASPIQDESKGLSLVHYNIAPSTAAFSIVSIGGSWSNKVIFFNPLTSGLVNRDFKDITSNGNTYCFDNLYWGVFPGSDIILLKMLSSTQLRIEQQAAASCGLGPWSFGSTFKEFER